MLWCLIVKLSNIMKMMLRKRRFKKLARRSHGRVNEFMSDNLLS